MTKPQRGGYSRKTNRSAKGWAGQVARMASLCERAYGEGASGQKPKRDPPRRTTSKQCRSLNRKGEKKVERSSARGGDPLAGRKKRVRQKCKKQEETLRRGLPARSLGGRERRSEDKSRASLGENKGHRRTLHQKSCTGSDLDQGGRESY